MRNVEKYFRTRQAIDVNIIRRLNVGWRIKKAADIQSEYLKGVPSAEMVTWRSLQLTFLRTLPLLLHFA